MEAGVGITWLIAGTIATSLSACAAAASAICSVFALRSQARAIDVSSYLQILEQLQQFERRLTASASVGEDWVFARREYVNFLEGLAHLYIKGRFGSGTADLCRDALSNSIAAIELNRDMMSILENSYSSPETFEYLGEFRKKHRDIIEVRKTIFANTAAP
jgi:hypothetical protein